MRRINANHLPPVIAICGRAGAGKSLAASSLAAHGFEVVKFAAPLKNMLRALGLTDREIEGDLKETPSALLGGRTPRFAMQTLGTEWGRDIIDHALWVNSWAASVERILSRGGRVVVDDCRFPNELTAALEYGRAVRIIRPGQPVAPAHPSETSLDGAEMLEVYNRGTPDELVAAIVEAFR